NRGLRSLLQEFAQRLEGTVGLRHLQPRPACRTRIMSWDLLRVVAQGRKVRILEMKIGAFTEMKAGAVGVLDVSTCRERRYRQGRQPRDNEREQDCVGERDGAARAVSVENRRTGFQAVHDAAFTSGKVRSCPACDHAVLFRPWLGAALLAEDVTRSRCGPPTPPPRNTETLHRPRAERGFSSPRDDADYANQSSAGESGSVDTHRCFGDGSQS